MEEGEGEDGGGDQVRVYVCVVSVKCHQLSCCVVFTCRKLQGEVWELTRELQQCRGEGSGGGGCEGEVQAALEEALREKDLLKQQLAR